MTHTTHPDLLLSSYCYDLPQELIAQEPAVIRDGSRLMVHDRQSARRTETLIADLASHLPKGVLVVNNTRVVPARLIGTKPTGGKVEMLITTPLPHVKPEGFGESWQATVDCLLRASKGIPIGETITFALDMTARVMERGEFGQCVVRLFWTGDLRQKLMELGRLPLPPYIRRPASSEDMDRYQTVYGRDDKAGSIAAPTAGLHLSQDMRRCLTELGYTWAEVTLYVGYGTFSPVRCEYIPDHAMHGEYCEIPKETAEIIRRAKQDGVSVTAVGTTAARSLEGVAELRGQVEPFQGWLNTFLYPGKPVRVVDHLITNFHLPQSTLLMLVAALAGREPILETYRQAIASRFRFFSYGDAMLIL